MVEQLETFIERYNNDLGEDSGFLLIIDNARQHHKALRSMTSDCGYFPPTTDEQSALMRNCVPVEPLGPSHNHGANARVHFYCLRQETSLNADNFRIMLLTPPGMSPFQPIYFRAANAYNHDYQHQLETAQRLFMGRRPL